MKEQIYTIPVNEAYDSGCECPLCYLEKKLEAEALEYGLGAAMMEPDYRIESNEKGYCNRHFEMLDKMPNKLSLSLVLETHLAEVREKLNNMDLSFEKKGFLKKSDKKTEKIKNTLGGINNGCIICDKVNHTMDRYIDVIFYLWEKEPEFRDKVKKSKGVCLKHLEKLIECAPKFLKEEKACEFCNMIINKELSELERLQGELKKFTLKFDYRNRDMDISGAEDAPTRVLEKLGGYVLG